MPSRMALWTAASVSASVITSTSPFGPTRNPVSSLFSIGIRFFDFTAILIRLCLTFFALNARSGDTCGSPSWISNFFEGCPNSIIDNFETFFLPTHREHVGGLAWQVEQTIAHTQDRLLEAAADGIKLDKLACLESVLALLATTFCRHKARALLGQLAAGGTSATSGDRAQMRQNLATHLVEIVFAGRLTGDHAFSEILIELRPRAANVGCRLGYCCHFPSNP